MVVGMLCKPSSRYLLKQIQVAISCGLFCIGSGCTLGFSGVLLPQIKEDDSFTYGGRIDAWIASSACLAMSFGCIAGGHLSDKYGRRFTHLIMTVPFLIGWIALSFATNITLLLVGRVFTGLSTGVYRSLGAVYLGEISNPTHRPFLVFTMSISTCLGILFGHTVGGYLNWRIACYIICVPIALGFILQLFLKESPMWLIYTGKIDEGSDVFKWFRGYDEISKTELGVIVEKQNNRATELTVEEKLRAVFSTAFMKPLVTAFIIFTTVQFCGVNTMSFYAVDLMNDTFGGEQDPYQLMLVTDAVRIIGVATLFLFSSYFPRRKSFIVIGAVVILLLIAIVAYIAVKPEGLGWLAVTVFMIYIALGSILVSLSWSFNREIFPSKLRGLGSGISAAFSFLLLFVCVLIIPITIEQYGILVTYSTFAEISLLGLILLYILLPQSDGKTLEEIENSYAKK